MQVSQWLCGRAIGPGMLRNPYRTLKASGDWQWVGNGCSPRNQGAGGEHEDLFMAAVS
ncbi:hypothetical protein PPUJ20028_32210 [Pseudomonas putida]|uniref:Uncharacterized protein n=1 Tax=Pseudomonas putida TaxID=303 RepID=A0AA37R8G6_PSEPU|nr:hypothetical protein PPUJ20028_32210 [Pseudomonas putida]GLO34995.1 hypothetical protein PPUN14671_18280 [Pseudomonas putida]